MPAHRPANQSWSREWTCLCGHNGMLQHAINNSPSAELRSLLNAMQLSADFDNGSNSTMINDKSIAIQAFIWCIFTSLSVDKMLLPRHMNLSTNFRGLPLRVVMASFCLKHSNSVLFAFIKRPKLHATFFRLCSRNLACPGVFVRSAWSSVQSASGIISVFFFSVYTPVNKCFWIIKVVDELTTLVSLAVFRPSQNGDKSEPANTIWAQEIWWAGSPETSAYKWPAAWQTLVGL